MNFAQNLSRKKENLMNKNLQSAMYKRINRSLEKLAANNMEPFFVESKEEVIPLVKKLIPEGVSIGAGGSETLNECGVIELLQSGYYRFFDRYAAETAEEKLELHRKALTADAYISGCNAITENGELYNVDCLGNRIAAIIFGPPNVVVVAGYNKIVSNLNEAVSRVKTTVAPPNNIRLNRSTPCSKLGECVANLGGIEKCSAGCKNEQRICCSYLVSGYQHIKNRIKIIIVGEQLGY